MNDRALHPIVSRPLQSRFLTIPQAPLCYWLRERFFELLAGRTLSDVADVCQGLATADDGRFVRFVWEVAPEEWAHPVRGRRWVPFEKGGGYGRWFGHQFWASDWEHDGRRLKQVTIERYGNAGKRVYNENRYFAEGWTYSYMARGSLGLRRLDDRTIFSHLAPATFPRAEDGDSHVGVIANCRFSSLIVRSLSAKIQLNESYVSRVPIPERVPDSLAAVESACIALKRYLVALDPTERSFGGISVVGRSLAEAWRRAADETEAVAAVLHTFEGISEREVFTAYGVEGEDLQAALDETGTPAGWLPLLAGYEAIPELPRGLAIPSDVLAPLSREPRRALSTSELSDLKRRLRALYEAGPGTKVADDEPATEEDDAEEESEAAISGARIPIPAETFLEELSQRLEVHPISVCWLLRDLREKDGAVCQPGLQRFVEDHVSVLVLRLLGHRWPREVEAGEPVPAWADADGVLPLSDGTGERTLLARVRDRMAEHFGADRVGGVEREFEEILGRPLGTWLSTDFFKRHIAQLQKRPIAWQIESAPGGNGKRQGRRSARKAPAFSCLVYHHRLDADLLPKLRTQYVGPLRASFQTELGSLEKIKERSADQDARRLELEENLEELKAFDARLEQVIVEGFASSVLDEIVAKEPLDKWTSRDGRARAPETRDALLAQERRYDPDLNDGVRVNIAPLQRAGLLPADMIAAKDLEKAIADRAEWRADERRWCREGKLARTGWWSENSAEAKPSAARHGDGKLPATEEEHE